MKSQKATGKLLSSFKKYLQKSTNSKSLSFPKTTLTVLQTKAIKLYCKNPCYGKEKEEHLGTLKVLSPKSSLLIWKSLRMKSTRCISSQQKKGARLAKRVSLLLSTQSNRSKSMNKKSPLKPATGSQELMLNRIASRSNWSNGKDKPRSTEFTNC